MDNYNLLQQLARHSQTNPDKAAIHILNSQNIEHIEQSITFADLFQASYNLAQLLGVNTSPGDRVILCYPASLDFAIAFYACLMARVVAVPVVVPSNLGVIKKFAAICQDCSPRLILADAKTAQQCQTSTLIQKYCDDYPVMRVFQQECYQGLSLQITPQPASAKSKLPVSVTLPKISDDSLALLQYTSGSTSEPKGVMITHGNLIDNIQSLAKKIFTCPTPKGITWLPHTHDMGLIGGLLLPVHQAVTMYVMLPLSFVRQPLLWLQAISHYQLTNTASPCFALKLCLDKLKPEHVQEFNLNTLQSFVIGSEPIHYQTVNKFFHALEPAGLKRCAFMPAYGLAESTLMVSIGRGTHALSVDYQALVQNRVHSALPSEHTHYLMSCGQPLQTVRIVRPETLTLCKEKEVGEIWLAGPSVAQGYWSSPALHPLLAENDFQARLANDDTTYFKTGDLGFIEQGALYPVGRSKEVIIINGLNYYPQDIEQTVIESDAALQQAACAVFRYRQLTAVTDSFVVLVRPHSRQLIENSRSLIVSIRKQLLKTYQLVPHDVQFVTFKFPKTTSGKLKRNACNQLYHQYCQTSDQRACHAETV